MSSVSSAPNPANGQAGEDGERMDEALVQDAEHDVDHRDGEDQEDEQARLGVGKGLRRARRSWR